VPSVIERLPPRHSGAHENGIALLGRQQKSARLHLNAGHRMAVTIVTAIIRVPPYDGPIAAPVDMSIRRSFERHGGGHDREREEQDSQARKALKSRMRH
jgi:hypothetical protein